MKKAKSKKRDMSKYRKKLLEKRTRIMGDVDQLESETLHSSQRDFSGDLSAYSLHMADQGTDASERETMLGLASSEEKAVERIDHAIERIDQGLYGTCELCGEEISDERLDALPEATVCIKCMKKYDL